MPPSAMHAPAMYTPCHACPLCHACSLCHTCPTLPCIPSFTICALPFPIHTPLPHMPPSPCIPLLPCTPLCHTWPPLDRMTDACENITFPQLLLRSVIIIPPVQDPLSPCHFPSTHLSRHVCFDVVQPMVT